MILVDIDGLKDVNDTLGHAQGDELIRSMAAVIRRRVRETDIIARLGGDEFGVLMPNTGTAAARGVALELLATIRGHGVVLGAKRLRPSACAGVAGFEHSSETAADVMVAADLALYEAKEGGRDRVSVYVASSSEEGAQAMRTAWSQRIRHGLDEALFVPYRQPIMSVPTGAISRYELLARLLDDQGRPISPGAFLPAAERSGMVPEIDRRMVSWAVDLIAEAEAAKRPVVYEVNLSARSLADRSMPRFISERVQESGIDPSSLVFEITETAAIANMQQARDVANALRALGCKFALDDFGAGFASFLYLKHIPLDALKIDGDFIRSLRTNPTDQLIVRHMAEIASSLGLYTIAEYVENRETLELVAEYGIDAVQGYHVGRPEPAIEVDLTPLGSRTQFARPLG